MVNEERSGLRVMDGVLLVGAGIIAIVVVFAVLSFVASLIWFVIKVIVVVAVLGGLAWLLLRRRS
jgi:hypothetical protein